MDDKTLVSLHLYELDDAGKQTGKSAVTVISFGQIDDPAVKAVLKDVIEHQGSTHERV